MDDTTRLLRQCIDITEAEFTAEEDVFIAGDFQVSWYRDRGIMWVVGPRDGSKRSATGRTLNAALRRYIGDWG